MIHHTFSLRACSTFVILFQLLPNGQAAEPAAASMLQAGAAAIDITPTEFPLNMPGGFAENFAKGAHDPLFARALVLSNETVTLAIVVVDNLGVAPERIEEAKGQASKATGIPTERMLISSTHTHSAPASSDADTSAPAAAYRKLLTAGVVKAIVDAHAALQSAQVGYAVEPLPDEVFNRRWFLKAGQMPLNPFGQLDTVKMNPGTSPEVLDRPAGPTDPDLTILSLQSTKRKPLALLANYSLHYVGHIPPAAVSADYFGEFARLMPSRVRGGEDFVAIMSNGASGDINNIPFNVIRPPREPFEQVRIVAQKAADAAWSAYTKIEKYETMVPLEMVQREVTLKYRRPTAEQLADAKAVLATEDEAVRARLPHLAEHYARKTVEAAERKEDTLTVKVQAVRIGNFALCGLPFETICEIGLDLKQGSPFEKTMVIGLANGRYGYLPTPAQHRLGGYETWLGTNQVEEEASVILTKNLQEMLAELNKQE